VYKDTATSISDVEVVDTDCLVKAIPDHFPPNQEKHLLKIDLSQNGTKSNHGGTSSKITHNQMCDVDSNLVQAAVLTFA
jgi:hypothetical protein